MLTFETSGGGHFKIKSVCIKVYSNQNIIIITVLVSKYQKSSDMNKYFCLELICSCKMDDVDEASHGESS